MSALNAALAAAVCVVFLALALWHVRMALAPAAGTGGAVPSVQGRPLFVPSATATMGVAVALVGCAALVASTSGWLPVPVPKRALVWLCWGLALGLLLRAVGDFRYVGFFKRVRDSRFAQLDTRLYSPLCLLLAAAVAWLAFQGR